MTTELTCIVCPLGCQLTINQETQVTGNKCKRGITYGLKEITNPTRTITSTVRIHGGLYKRIPVKTSDEISKKDIFRVMRLLDEVLLEAPVQRNQVVLQNILGTSVDIITTRSMKKVLQ